jgi:hypothetical protein
MTLNYKYTILYTFVSLLLFWLIIKYGSSVCNSLKIVEGLTNGSDALTDFEKYSHKIIPFPKDAVIIDYNDINSPLYSRTVNLPINDPVSCNNFCGPNAQCLITREQCTSDIDCQGCNPGPTPRDACLTKNVAPYDAAGKLGQNQLQYSPLTTGYNNHNVNFAETYPGSKDSQIKRPYLGLDLWTDSFNKGLELYNKKRESADKYSEGISQQIQDEEADIAPSKMSYYEMRYPTTKSATGQFFETTPPASNSAIQ